MTKDEQKQQDEMNFFNVFRRLAPELGLGEGSSPKPPAADVLSHIGSDRIGIEITRIIRRNEKRRESEESKIIEAARRQYELLAMPFVGLAAHWIERDLSPKGRDLLAKAIASFVALNLPPRGNWVSHDWTSLPGALADNFHCLRIERLCDYDQNFWSIARAGWVGPLDPPQIQFEISGKEQNVSDYRLSCDRVWLLLVLEGDPSSLCSLSESACTYRYATSFDRVFLLGAAPRDVTELAIRPT